MYASKASYPNAGEKSFSDRCSRPHYDGSSQAETQRQVVRLSEHGCVFSKFSPVWYSGSSSNYDFETAEKHVLKRETLCKRRILLECSIL